MVSLELPECIIQTAIDSGSQLARSRQPFSIKEVAIYLYINKCNDASITSQGVIGNGDFVRKAIRWRSWAARIEIMVCGDVGRYLARYLVISSSDSPFRFSL